MAQNSSQIVAQAYSYLNFLPATLSMCSFTGSASDWAVQKPCFESLQSYCDAMEGNLVRIEENLAALGQDAQTEHQDMLDKAAR